jgi:hypothetical protein
MHTEANRAPYRIVVAEVLQVRAEIRLAKDRVFVIGPVDRTTDA